MQKRINKIKGFTLIEIMVSVSIFAVIMLMVSSSIFTVFESNRKSQSLRAVMDNLNLSLESMTRTIRFGKGYHCDISGSSPPYPTQDCPSGATSIAVLDSSGNTVSYELSTGVIVRKIGGGAGANITSSDVTIDKLKFYVTGSTPYSSGSDLAQPKVILIVDGHAGVKTTSSSYFSLQTTISQRQFDSQ